MVRVKTARVIQLALILGAGTAFGSSLMASPPHAAVPAAPLVTAVTEDPEGGAPGNDERGELTIPLSQLGRHMPDLERYFADAPALIERARQDGDQAEVAAIQRVLERIGSVHRPRQVHLTLEDALRRALANSYAIEMKSYDPAVETTRLVEAQAAFDAVFYTSIGKSNIDRPTGSQLAATDIDQFTSRYGVRKLLQTGMQVGTSFGLDRQKIGGFEFQQVNPEYTADLQLEMRQPLLRGFGIDFNRSQILIARNNQQMSQWAFHRQVRDTLRIVEELYWRLMQARRAMVISARLLADFEAIYEYLDARKDFDVIPVQLNATRADLEISRAEFVGLRAGVFDAEDRLIAAINDPEIPMGAGIEIIPDDLPQLGRILVDPMTEVQAALDNRPEIKESELTIATAKIAVGQAKNLELPRLDLTFRTTFDGLSGTADRAVDELSRGKFIEYYVGVEFEIPVGNRAARAAHRRAQLQHAQAEVALKALLEEVIRDVHLAIRELNTAYDQIDPSYESAEARQREVQSIVARAERKDHGTLINELGARRSLANTRRLLLDAMVRYNVAIIELERAKGTLLRYNNVTIAGEPE